MNGHRHTRNDIGSHFQNYIVVVDLTCDLEEVLLKLIPIPQNDKFIYKEL
jgi:hypothetical protein